MNVTLTQPGTGKTKQLSGDELDRLLAELKRTANQQTTPRRAMLGVAPDLLITLTKPGYKREFSLYGRTVLRDLKTRRERQFYMGLLLEEWMR